MAGVRQPVLYVSHGGGPCFWTDLPEPIGPKGYLKLKEYLSGLVKTLPARPKAFLIVSAHWEEKQFTVNTSAKPGMIYDYYGFPEHVYKLNYPAPGDPALAKRIASLATAAGVPVATTERGYDHGVFVPFLIVDPAGSIPVVTMSLRRDMNPAAHLALGAALAPLRDEGVLIVGSGNSFHDLRSFLSGETRVSAKFDAALTEAAVAPDRKARLARWETLSHARDCHPREEHLIPLLVAAGASNDDERAVRDFHDVIGGKAHSGYRFG